MGNIYSTCSSYNFDIIQHNITNKHDFILINTLLDNNQDCLIKYTINAKKENEIINELLHKNKKKEIVVYGMNHKDISIIKKYTQLKKLGFTNVHIYFGGLFEWLLLKEVYGSINFPTDGETNDILKYK
uniref:Rhodanese domain-containing protein n=1 Tax=viral metagenome TaxID=1070528 RepID=A0A6C0JMN8_9ZZZZ